MTETAKTSFKVLPADLKARAANHSRSLKIIIYGDIPEAMADYNSRENLISMDWGDIEAYPEPLKRKILLRIIFHEVGHAIDANYFGKGNLPKKERLSYREWKPFWNPFLWKRRL